MLEDRNFDNLVDKFERRIYGTFKGQLRLELLQQDLGALRNCPPLHVWDAGCGLGQMACWFAEAGHEVIGCDISQRMLERAQQSAQERDLPITFHHAPAQAIAPKLPPQDLVLFHAVIEWLAQPLETLQTVADKVKPGGHLSLLFFNHHALIYRNALRGTWRLRYILDEKWLGKGKKLTPPHPQKPEALCDWLAAHGFEIIAHTGIRVFHDYMDESVLVQTDLNELREVELKYCREPTFRNMGRYIHLLARRTA
ncbi:S-adenosylmethionine-dependent methyltransferase [Sulfurivirga caldicuralii]|uniref:tRNA 5-carboxymethoxyuridine methyltransferase n=1 Tax=Sulfurivirga caldicuralii TaxID=364032 RepID=A0A1N6HDG8_9GAMM|nr:methyltransferase domain-containing protein [Sulfurivirga caldicuralii]SIO17832.1 S-adenosylmethionine-dependent methyltransferase [Sulfurivirga caldicuralii]